MLRFLSLAALLFTAAGASPFTHITSLANLTTATTGTTVRILDINGRQFIVDPGYPQAPEFTPVNGAPALPTGAMTNQDTFKIQSAPFPDMFISYASIGIAATTPIHSQLVLRGNANAAVFSLQTISGGELFLWSANYREDLYKEAGVYHSRIPNLEHLILEYYSLLTSSSAIPFQPLLSVPTPRRIEIFMLCRSVESSTYPQIWDRCSSGIKHLDLSCYLDDQPTNGSVSLPHVSFLPIALESLQLRTTRNSNEWMARHLSPSDLSSLKALSSGFHLEILRCGRLASAFRTIEVLDYVTQASFAALLVILTGLRASPAGSDGASYLATAVGHVQLAV
ncbi:hypothetical protein FB451DRAFT_1553805 [Mycena latifolia]|nr:hypothetical protein FB451DRAFT_1553805 [Mycena latifolia]